MRSLSLSLSLRRLLSSVSTLHVQLGPVKFLSYTLETVSFSSVVAPVHSSKGMRFY